MASIAKLPKLVSLDVAWTAVGDGGLEKLVGMPALNDLEVDGTKVTDKGAKVLQERGVTVHDIPPPRRLANEGILAKLTRLGVSVNTRPDGTLRVVGKITDDDVIALGAVGNLGCLVLTGGGRVTQRGIDGLAKSQTLFELNLARTAINDEVVKALVKLPKLRTLDLSDTKITDAGVASLKGHGSLRELNLANTRISNAAIEALSGNEQLTSLDISGTRVDDAGMIHVGKLRHLRVLRVNKTISNEALAAIEGLVELNDFAGPAEITDVGLNHLRNMTNMQCIGRGISRVMGRVTDNGLRSIGALTEMRQLDLENSQVTDNGLRSMLAMTELRQLDLENSRITDEGMKIIGQMRNLVTLSLCKTKITDVGIREIANIKGLRSLDCMETDLGNAGLVQIGTLRKLDSLCLAGTRVTSAGMKSLTNMPELYELELGATQVDDEGMASIAKVPKLAVLYLSGTAVSDRGLEQLVGMPGLKEVYVKDTKVTEKGAKVLQARWVIVRDVPQPAPPTPAAADRHCLPPLGGNAP